MKNKPTVARATDHTLVTDFLTLHDVPTTPKGIRYIYLLSINDKPVEVRSTYSINDSVYELFFAGKEESYYGKPDISFTLLSVIQSDTRQILDAITVQKVKQWQKYYLEKADKFQKVNHQKQATRRRFTPEEEAHMISLYCDGYDTEYICNLYKLQGDHLYQILNLKGYSRYMPVTERMPVYKIKENHIKNKK